MWGTHASAFNLPLLLRKSSERGRKLDQLSLSALHERYQGDRRRNRPSHPAMMLKLLVHARAAGVFCSRKIARKTDADGAFPVLAAGNRPDFRTINRFGGEQLDEFKKLFVEIAHFASPRGEKCGLIHKFPLTRKRLGR